MPPQTSKRLPFHFFGDRSIGLERGGKTSYVRSHADDC